MLPFVSRSSRVAAVWIAGAVVPLALLGACGGSDVGDEAFGGGGAAGTPSATTAAVGPGPVQASSAATGGGSTSDGGGGSTSDGGGGSTSDGGGGSTSDGGGGGGGAGGGADGGGGGGGAGDPTCDDGCAPVDDADADCDDDGDPNGADCQPCNADVHHEQEAYFDEPYVLLGSDEESFDYDCSATLESEYSYVPGGCDAFNANNCPEGDSVYAGDQAPECGVEQTVEDCALAGIVIGMCSADGPSSSVLVRCR